MWDIMTPIEFLQGDETAGRVFMSVERARGRASGWFVAKDSEISPETAASVLKSLKDLGVVASTAPGLDGYYYLTELGIKVRNSRVHAAAV